VLVDTPSFGHATGQTALHLASMYGQLETVRTLVELGVDKEAKDKVRNLMMMMMA
jgi:ankyrin repeat protein